MKGLRVRGRSWCHHGQPWVNRSTVRLTYPDQWCPHMGNIKLGLFLFVRHTIENPLVWTMDVAQHLFNQPVIIQKKWTIEGDYFPSRNCQEVKKFRGFDFLHDISQLGIIIPCVRMKKMGRSWPSKIGYIHPEIGGVPYPSKTVPHFPTGILFGFISIVCIYIYICVCVCHPIEFCRRQLPTTTLNHQPALRSCQFNSSGFEIMVLDLCWHRLLDNEASKSIGGFSPCYFVSQ